MAGNTMVSQNFFEVIKKIRNDRGKKNPPQSLRLSDIIRLSLSLLVPSHLVRKPFRPKA